MAVRLKIPLGWLAVLLLVAGGATAQAPQTPSPVPAAPQAEPAPAPVPPVPAPSVPAPNMPGPGAGPAAPPMTMPQTPEPPRSAATTFKPYPTLVGPSANPADMDEVTLPAKPALAREGRTTWDNGFSMLMETFKRLHDQAVQSGLKPAGKPLARFLETNDEGFRFQAMLPVEAPASPPALPEGFAMTRTPEGPALRFVHKAPYEEIDSTYEAITAYLDAKNIAVEDSFVEEYATDLTDPADPELEINIFVTRKR